MDTQQVVHEPEDKRGIHFRKKVEDDVYRSPSWCVAVWAETLKREEKELTRVLATAGMEYVLPWRRVGLEFNQQTHGNMGKSVYTKLITLSLEGRVIVEFAAGAGHLATTSTKQGFMGIMKFIVLERGVLDQGKDDYGEIHTTYWSKQSGRKMTHKTISHGWRTLGLTETTTVDGKLEYIFNPKLRETHLAAVNPQKRKRSAAPQTTVVDGDPAVGVIQVDAPFSSNKRRSGKTSSAQCFAERIAEARKLADESTKRALVAELHAKAMGLMVQVVEKQGEINVLRASLERAKAESNDVLAKAAALLVDASIDKDGVAVVKKRAEAAVLSGMADGLGLVESNTHAKIFELSRESDVVQASVDALRRRADEIDVTSSLLMMAGGGGV